MTKAEQAYLKWKESEWNTLDRWRDEMLELFSSLPGPIGPRRKKLKFVTYKFSISSSPETGQEPK